MNLFFSGNKKDMMVIRDLLNELLSDPQLDKPSATLQMEDKYGRIKIERRTELKLDEEEEA